MTKKTQKKGTAPKTRLAAVEEVAIPEVRLDDVAVPDAQARIAILAYLMAERRGFAPGFELDDWLAAEAELRQNGHRD
jgi:hypothetical protein